MILSKTPLRISFCGGGSDYFNYLKKTKGRVVVTAIDKYIYILVNQKHNNEIRISYSETENVKNTKEIKHQIIKESLKFFNINDSIEVVTIADIPSSGSGLASSSALTVGLVNALSKYKNLKINKKILSQKSCEIEIKKCKKPIGMQDQYSTAYGGFNRIEFFNNQVKVTKINLNNMIEKKFKNHLMLFYTGINRKADKILGDIKKSGKQFANYEELSNLAKDFENELVKGNILNCGKILHKNWILKKKLNEGVSTLNLDELYEKAINSGAVGGKILGAGGGGFFLFIAEPKHHNKIIKSLKKLKFINFNFEKKGSQIFKV
jgi:D-glycero-alpha-D-manno-heptose-7-phosphate kinase